ncbi:tetratricopeptide repeat protein [bacterium]|nr:MAG: tetratricopeptide repeat protein [bacterium]
MTFKKHSTAIFAALLAALVLAVYWRTTGFELLTWDDNIYITKNPLVTGGLRWESVKTSFSSGYGGHWIPLTWLSYMADVSFFGPEPGVFHRTNVILYLASVILLFLFLRSATGSTRRSFFAVALFAMHPLRVESVAWVTERKDVLSGLFFILALWSYLLYTRTKTPGWYATLIISAVLGILSKPILVVLPVALLLLDFWPLGRFTTEDGKKKLQGFKTLLLEKAPLFALSFSFVAITLYNQLINNPKVHEYQFSYGLANAATAYWKYLGRTFFPNDLILQYDTPTSSAGALAAIVSFASLVAITFLAFRFRRRAPEGAFGWFWFLLLLFPNSGIVPAGMQSFSDRFTYLPHIGLAIAFVWGTAHLARRVRLSEKNLLLPGAALVAVLAVASVTFTGYWKNTYTLFGHIDEIYGGRNALALNCLATASLYGNDPATALSQLDRLRQVEPRFPSLNHNRGYALYKLGRYDEALEALRLELAANPQNAAVRSMISTVMRARAEKPGR